MKLILLLGLALYTAYLGLFNVQGQGFIFLLGMSTSAVLTLAERLSKENT
jgi:hypothetical protein